MSDVNENLIDDRDEATIGMDEIDEFDFNRAMMLMSVMEKVANVAPKSASISGLAAAALNEMNEEAKAIARRRAEEFAKEERKAEEQRAAEARERFEAEEAEKAAADEAARSNTTVAEPTPAFTTPTQADVARRL